MDDAQLRPLASATAALTLAPSSCIFLRGLASFFMLKGLLKQWPEVRSITWFNSYGEFNMSFLESENENVGICGYMTGRGRCIYEYGT